MKKRWKQVCSLLLVMSMVFTMLPMSAFADTGSMGSGTLPLGAGGTIIAFAGLDEDIATQVVEIGTTENELKRPKKLTVTVTSGSAITATVDVLGWTADPTYDGDTEGTYTFTPALALPVDLTLAKDLAAPVITVSVAKLMAQGAASMFSSSASITIDEINFPDLKFRAWLLGQSYGEDRSLTTEEIAGITSIDVSNKSISNLAGIEHFTALTRLKCNNNNLTELDMSNNTALTSLDCGFNKLTVLDVSKNTALTTLNCYYNELVELDVSNNTALTSLDCGFNKLAVLDVSKNTALTILDCGNNKLTILDVSKNTALTSLICNNNNLTVLDVIYNVALTTLNCRSNKFTALDVSKNTALTTLDCGYNSNLTVLDVSKNIALTELRCSANSLKVLNVSQNILLTLLYCDRNKLTALDMSENTALEDLDCAYNLLTALDVTCNTELNILSCQNNYMTDQSAITGLNTSITLSFTFFPQYSGTPLVDADTPIINSQPIGASYTQNTTATPLSVTASVTDGGTLSYQWVKNEINGTMGGTNVGTDSPSYTPSTETVGTTYYYCIITNTNSGVSGEEASWQVSNTAAITVTASTLPALPIPSNLKWEVQADDSLKLSWDLVESAIGYQVKIYNNEDIYNVVELIDDAWHFIDTPEGSGRYTFTVAAVGDGIVHTNSPHSTKSEVFVVASATTITGVTVPIAMTYGANMRLNFTITFSEPIYVIGNPHIALTIGTETKHAIYDEYQEANILRFKYDVQNTDVDLDGIVLSPQIDLNGGTIKNAGGSDAVLTFTPPNTSGILLDGVTPVIYTIRGTIKGSDTNTGIEDASVIINVGGKPYESTTTNSTGEYRSRPFTAGTYSMEVSAPGYETAFISDIVISGADVIRNFTLIKTGSPTPYPVTLNIKQDGETTSNDYSPYQLRLSTDETIIVEMSGDGATRTAELPNGIWKVYLSLIDKYTGVTFTVKDGPSSATLDWYSGGLRADSEGSATNSTYDVTINGESIISNSTYDFLRFLKGDKVILTAHGKGADSYSYTWSGTYKGNPINATGKTFTINSVDGKINIVCTVTGIGLADTNTVTVNSPGAGSSGNGIYREGEKVNISAGVPSVEDNLMFQEWTSSPIIPIANEYSANTGFIMPAHPVTVTAKFAPIPVGEKAIFVTSDGNGIANTSQNSATTGSYIWLNAIANMGYRFKEWQVIAGGVSLVEGLGSPDGFFMNHSFIMPNEEVRVKAIFEPVTTYTVTFDLGGGTRTGGGELVQTVPHGGYAIVPRATRNNYTFFGWDKALTDPITSNLTVKAIWRYNGGGSTGDGGNTGGDSGSGSYTPPVSTPPQAQSNQPVTPIILVTATAGANGTAGVNIPENAITDAIAKAQADAKAQGNMVNGISVGMNVTMPRGASSLTATLTQGSLNSLVNAGVSRFNLNGAPVSLGLDLGALQEIQRQSEGDISINIAPATGLSTEASDLLGNRPVYNITISYVKDGKTINVTSLGSGIATLSIPYTPGENEAVGCLFGVYVDGEGKAQRISSSVYDANSGSLLFSTGHFSIYGVGYAVSLKEYKDIDIHWAKESIDYVLGRGLIGAASMKKFSPDSYITRGALVTALGRMAEVDTNKYTTSSFTDIQAGTTYSPYIEWACEEGIIKGISNDKFAPNRPITREEVALILQNYANVTGYKLTTTRDMATYVDSSSISSSHKDAVKAMQQAGIMMGGSNHLFNPKSYTTRAEVSCMLHRYIKLIIDPNTAQGWEKDDTGQWLYYKEGLMVVDKWLQIENKWYYFNPDGSLAKSTQVDGYEVDENGVRKNK